VKNVQRPVVENLFTSADLAPIAAYSARSARR
jgi:hypothetical protein